MYRNKRRILIVAFFLFYFMVLQFTSDLQYYLEYGDDLKNTILYRLSTAPFSMLVFFLFFQLCVPLAIRKQYVRFSISVILFIGLLEIYLHLLDWLIWHMPHLSDSSRNNAKKNWANFSVPRQSFWLSCMHMGVLTGLGFYISRRTEEKKLHDLKEQHLKLELDNLKAQVHPHFFFNTLNSIYSLALHGSKKTAGVVEQLAQLMRYMIYECNKPQVMLSKEIDFLHNYVQLEKIRHEENVPVSFTCQGNPRSIEIPPLLFMPLLENGFKHGFRDPAQSTWIEAVMVIEDGEIVFEVKNSRSPGFVAQDAGIGLDNLKKRLTLLFPGKHILRINEQDHQFEVNLTLQLA